MNSKDYWQSRSEQNIMSADKSAEELLKIMKESYNQANKLIRNEIDNFYSRFSYNQKISYEETLKRMDKKELKQFREQAWEYYKEAYDKNWETAYTDKMRTLSGRAYMSRLEGLKVNIAYQYQKIAEELNVKLEEGLTKQYEKSFEQTMFDVAKGTGMGLDVTRINGDIVKKTIERKWMSGNYSSRIWENKEKLVSTLNSTLPVLFTLGKSPNECAKVLSDKLDSNYKNCVRLVRTEFTHIANESSADAYKECGIDQYEYLATLDQRTDDLCGELDGKVFKVGDKQVGVNFPPMHPNCRCTTVAHFPDDYTERIAKDEKGKYFYVDPKTTFKDWKEMVKGGSRETGAEVVEKAKPKEHTQEYKHLIEYANIEGVERLEVKPLEKQLTEKEIITKLAGGDMTKGSCASLGLAYIGNRCGYDVTDFRSGKSQTMFSSFKRLKEICSFEGIKATIEKVKIETTGTVELLNKIESNKEYYLVTGGHAAIVRLSDTDGYQYLEMQSGIDSENGWQSFNKYGTMKKTLMKRFGCAKTQRQILGEKVETSVLLAEVDSFKGNEEFKEILEFLNTSTNKQKKGSKGHVR